MKTPTEQEIDLAFEKCLDDFRYKEGKFFNKRTAWYEAIQWLLSLQEPITEGEKKHKYFPGNYDNTCCLCKKQIHWCDKLCFVCEKCYELNGMEGKTKLPADPSPKEGEDKWWPDGMITTNTENKLKASQDQGKVVEWIEAKKLLPNDGEKVCFRLKSGEIRFGSFKIEGIWGHRNVFNSDGFLTLEWVTHWLRIPPFPEALSSSQPAERDYTNWKGGAQRVPKAPSQPAEDENFWTDELVGKFSEMYRFSSGRTSMKQFKQMVKNPTENDALWVNALKYEDPDENPLVPLIQLQEEYIKWLEEFAPNDIYKIDYIRKIDAAKIKI